MVDGEIAPRPGADGGSDRDTLVVDRFIRTRPGITCERQMADAELVNTYWRLDSLEGEPFPKGVGKKEAHILLETGDDGAYRATVGCNSIRGSYTLDGDMLAFGGGAMTMMACPDPLDRLERQLTAMLGEVTGFDTEGETLVLRDAGGNGQDLAVSADGAHLAFACGGGNGPGYSVFDFAPHDFLTTNGEWTTGAYPR